jgi:1-aminocyclopropane-1-carboxylate deaminase/D-cysteine desulfhydrase-like pyridoxal-dependent ACC family enzyme
MNNEISLQNCIIQQVIPQNKDKKAVQWDVLRLDLIHPVISGNKYFKLRLYLEQAINDSHTGILTFGGPYSNHILASAFAANKAGLSSIGIIRGEEPANWSPTLTDAKSLGMELIFTERERFTALSRMPPEKLSDTFPEYTVIPEGGYGITGMIGAKEIHALIPPGQYDWLACACGTGTMMAGLVHGAAPGEKLLGIPVLKNYVEMEDDIRSLLPSAENMPEIHLEKNYHFGGYAKQTAELISFMNFFYHTYTVPTDFVYTAKLMYGVNDLISKGYFPGGSRILAIHSGGLQGNRSLKNGILDF